MWCPGAVVLFFVAVGWFSWRLWRWWFAGDQLPRLVRAAWLLFTPAGFVWLFCRLRRLWRWWFGKESARPLPVRAVKERALTETAEQVAPVLILTTTSLGPLPDYFDSGAIHPAATARVLRSSGAVNSGHVEEWKAEIRWRGYEVRTIAIDTPSEGWEIRVPTIPTRDSVFA